MFDTDSACSYFAKPISEHSYRGEAITYRGFSARPEWTSSKAYFVGVAPKFYCAMPGDDKLMVKTKGVSMNKIIESKQQVAANMKELVMKLYQKEEFSFDVTNPTQFERNNKKLTYTTHVQTKNCGVNECKRVTGKNYISRPFGYE